MNEQLLHWSSCSDCRRVRTQLATAGRRPPTRDFFANPLTRTELEELSGRAGGASSIFSYKSPSFRVLGLTNPADLSDSELLDLILEDPRRLRRPILVTGRAVLIGPREILQSLRAV